MKRWIASAAMCATRLGLGWGAYRVAAPPDPALSRFVPQGSLLYLQAKDFSSLLSDWDSSAEKKQWLKSKNEEVFSQSRLLLRLKDAAAEFASAAGVPANADLLHQVAGKEAAFALYDIGKLQFLYITRLSSGDAMQSALWQTRSKFETRSAAGVNFFYRSDPDSGREVAFALVQDYLLLATREDLVVGALQLITRANAHSLEEESWWVRPVSSTGAPGDLRMVLNLEKMVPSPYFRSYWIQRNITAMKQYSAAVSDLTRSGGEYREERLLLKKDAAPPDALLQKGPDSVADLQRLIPENIGFYEARANPDAKLSFALLTGKILAPHVGPRVAPTIAPEVQLGNGETGSAADLETRIDPPPSQRPISSGNENALENVLARHKILAQLQLESAERDPAGVFVRFHSAVAFSSDSDWNEQEIRAAVVEFLGPALTTSELGLEWKTSSGCSVLDGLWPLAAAARGKYLILADDPLLLARMLANFNQKAAGTPAALAAGFDHGRERGNFSAMSKFLAAGVPSAGFGSAPEFFSENIASLSSVLKNVSSEKLVVRDAADRQTQVVTYTWH